MISLDDFTSAVHDVLERELNDPQLTCVSHGIDSALIEA